MANVLATEVLKVRKRWMPYVLLLLMVAGAAVLIWLIGYVGYKEDPRGEYRGDASSTFAFPWSSRPSWTAVSSGAPQYS